MTTDIQKETRHSGAIGVPSSRPNRRSRWRPADSQILCLALQSVCKPAEYTIIHDTPLRLLPGWQLNLRGKKKTQPGPFAHRFIMDPTSSQTLQETQGKGTRTHLPSQGWSPPTHTSLPLGDRLVGQMARPGYGGGVESCQYGMIHTIRN